MPHAHIEVELDDGAIDAFVACPEGPGRRAPILVFAAGGTLDSAAESLAVRLSAHNYFVIAPDLARRGADERREAAWALVDYLADDRRVDDTRVGVLGFQSGADLGLQLAAGRSERVAAVAAYGGRGFGLRSALEISYKINGVVRLGYFAGVTPKRAAFLESALSLAGVPFDIDVCEKDPCWPCLLDLFGRTLAPEPFRDGAPSRGHVHPVGPPGS